MGTARCTKCGDTTYFSERGTPEEVAARLTNHLCSICGWKPYPPIGTTRELVAFDSDGFYVESAVVTVEKVYPAHNAERGITSCWEGTDEKGRTFSHTGCYFQHRSKSTTGPRLQWERVPKDSRDRVFGAKDQKRWFTREMERVFPPGFSMCSNCGDHNKDGEACHRGCKYG